MAQITSVTSEALQAKIRELLPSQQGFGEDLQASNVIIPIIDLTSTSEGSGLAVNLQTALDSSTAHTFRDGVGTDTIINTTGFWRLVGTMAHKAAGPDISSSIIINDGLADNIVYKLSTDSDSSTDDPQYAITFDLVVFIKALESVKINCSNANVNIDITYRQIADINGNLVNPNGFTSE